MKRRLAAILAADVVGYSRLMADDEERTLADLRAIREKTDAHKVVYDSGIGYSMTKFASVALSHATRHAGWEDGVRCTALCPGYVATDMTSGVESVSQDQMIPPGDLAQLVLTLLSLPNSASVAELAINCRDDIVA